MAKRIAAQLEPTAQRPKTMLKSVLITQGRALAGRVANATRLKVLPQLVWGRGTARRAVEGRALARGGVDEGAKVSQKILPELVSGRGTAARQRGGGGAGDA